MMGHVAWMFGCVEIQVFGMDEGDDGADRRSSYRSINVLEGGRIYSKLLAAAQLLR